MFEPLIDRLSSILGLSREEALRSDFVKKLCLELVNGQVLIMDSRKNKFSTIETQSHLTEQNPSIEERLLTQ